MDIEAVGPTNNGETSPGSTTEEFLTVSHVSKNFAGVIALDDVSFTIHRGEIRCLVGENGSGKSTLIKIIAGVYQPNDGQIAINGRQRRSLRPKDAIDAGIQVIYQDFSLFPNLTVAENIALNYQLAQNKRVVNWNTVRQIAQEALGMIDVQIDLDAIVGELPVADRQLVAISRALLQNAQLIIMDEPTTTLTQREIDALFKVIRSLQAKGIAILFVSHKLNEIQEIADGVMVLRNGHKVADGKASDFDIAKLAHHMTGTEINEKNYIYEPEAGSKPLFQVENLTRSGAFQDISFDLKPGEILGITGLLGSGRSELALALFGVQPATSGRVILDGKPVVIKSIQDAIEAGIGYVPEDRLTEGLFFPQSINRNIVVRTLEQILGAANLISNTKLVQQADDWVNKLHIKTNNPTLPVSSLSGGNQQRVVLAKWLASAPKLLVLNAPTVGVDVGSKMELHDEIKDLARQHMGILVISDDLPELMTLCNRILLMQAGRIAEEFITQEIDENILNQKLIQANE